HWPSASTSCATGVPPDWADRTQSSRPPSAAPGPRTAAGAGPTKRRTGAEERRIMKFTRRTGITALAAAPLLTALAACNRGGGDGQGLDIALISKGFQRQFWQAVNKGAEEAAEEHGISITFEGPAAETEIDEQLQMFQAAVDR